tara:strand:- start:2174 stop:2632 length:459 start_codon:yes stop_codon:yes gene_type:complete
MKKIVLIIFLITLSCSNNKVINTHGQSALDIKANKITVFKMNKNDILRIFGKPSTNSMFDENKWYYIERKKINQSIIKLGKQKIDRNYILEVNFDKYGIVESKKLYSLEDMNDIKVTEDVTSNSFSDQSYIQKVLNSVRQKIDSPKRNRTKN